MTNTNTQTTELPDGWVWVKHYEISDVNIKPDFSEIDEDIEVSFIPMAAVEEKTGQYNLDKVRKFKNVSKGYTPFANGDLIFAKITPCMENGKLAVLNELKNGIGFGSTEFHTSRFYREINTKFYFYYFLQEAFRRDAKRNMTGSAGQLRVPSRYFKEACVPLPPLAEQHRIVAKIEELFSDLDHSVAALEKAREQFKTYRQAVLKYAFEGKLTAEWRQVHSPAAAAELLARIQAERAKSGKPAKPLLPLTEGELAELPSLPEGWVWVKAEALSEFITKGTTPKKGELFSNSGEIPFIKVYNLTHIGTLDFSVNPTFTSIGTHKGFLARSIVFPGDILMNIVGPPLGKVSLVPDTYSEWNINQAVVRYRPYDILLNKYLKHFLLSQVTIRRMMRKSKATAGQFNLTLEICRDLLVPLCSVPEQCAIIEEIESRLSVVDKLEETIETSLQQAEALRQSILKQAFAGKLVPQDPVDEPAEKLLERIKEANAKGATVARDAKE